MRIRAVIFRIRLVAGLIGCNFAGNCDTECPFGAIDRMWLVAMPNRKPADRKQNRSEDRPVRRKAAAGLPHSKTAASESGRYNGDRLVAGLVVIFGERMASGVRTNLQARGCAHLCGAPDAGNRM